MGAGTEVPAAVRRSQVAVRRPQFDSDSDAAERRQTQSDNDASGYLQRVAGRFIRTAPTKSHAGDGDECSLQVAVVRLGIFSALRRGPFDER